MLILLADNRAWIRPINTFVYAGLFLTVAGMSILPAILMISMQKGREN
jgi:ABC-type phosphate/phosphonate transport system permease subunit